MMISHLSDIAFFALLFFVLVFIHELGHFLMARWVGIHVERFSIGMGPSVFSFKGGATEYKLGLLPLGGYVKMAGDDPTKEYSEAEKKIGFLTQTPPKKLLVVFGGPVFNLILPIFLFALMLASGNPILEPFIGTIEKGLPGELAGLKSGDKVLAIDGQNLRKWGDLEERVSQTTTHPLMFTVERWETKLGRPLVLQIPVQPKLMPSKSKFGEDIEVGRIGVSPEFSVAEIFFEDPKSPVAKAGLLIQDRVLSIDGTPTQTESQFWEKLENLSAGSSVWEVDRASQKMKFTVAIPPGNDLVSKRLGLFPTNLVVGKVEPANPAEKAGLMVNDRLLKINGIALSQWEDVSKAIRSSDGKPVQLEWSRAGKIMTATLNPEKTVIDDPLMGKDNPLARDAVYRIGVSPATHIDTSTAIERSLNPLTCLKHGVTETWNMASMTVIALSKLVTGQLSLKLLGSPIMIYKVAGNSYRKAGGGYMGWISFLSTLALLSITLGLMNLLPIPVLDGGHATFFVLEAIRGKPLSLRMMEIANQVGLFVLACLFALVIYNDFNRYGFLDRFTKMFQ